MTFTYDSAPPGREQVKPGQVWRQDPAPSRQDTAPKHPHKTSLFKKTMLEYHAAQAIRL